MRWGRIVGLAFALEAALFATLLPLQPLLSPKHWIDSIAIGCAVLAYVAGRLAGRGLSSGAAVHGLLVGGFATLIYIAMNIVGPGGLSVAVAFYGAPLFVSLNALRIAGCLIGAIHASRPATAVPR